MKKLFSFLLLSFLLVGCSHPQPPASTQPTQPSESTPVAESTAVPSSYARISMAEAQQRLSEESDYILLDVRTPEEYAEGHIPSAINVPNERISTAEIPELPNKDQTIYVYCRSGNRSRQAADKLLALGYTGITEIGGIKDWPGEIVKD